MQISAIVLLAPLALLADDASRPDFSGTWRLDAASSQIHSHIPANLTWTIDQKDEAIHFVESGIEKGGAMDVQCGTRGADCKTKEAGKAVTVSFWYNGPALVEMETEGNEVTKRKMQLSGDRGSILVEVTHIVPEGRLPEKLVLKKQR